jgi:ParB-like chromosome segregation protein Spo0J/transposase-like protein
LDLEQPGEATLMSAGISALGAVDRRDRRLLSPEEQAARTELVRSLKRDGLTIREIADKTGLAKGTVQQEVKRAAEASTAATTTEPPIVAQGPVSTEEPSEPAAAPGGPIESTPDSPLVWALLSAAEPTDATGFEPGTFYQLDADGNRQPAPYQVMPTLDEEAAEQLRASIEAQGVLMPVIIDEYGNIIDGHHRAAFATALGIDFPTEVRAGLTDAEKRSLAYTLNAARRQLSREQKRDLVAKSLKDDPQLSDRAHGRRAGVDHKTVATVRAVMEGRGEIPHAETRTDAAGREQPASKPTDAEPEQPGDEATDDLAQANTELDSPHELDEPATAESTDTTPDDDDTAPDDTDDTTDEDDGVLVMKTWELSAASNMGGLDARVHVTFLGPGHVDADPVDIALGKSRLPARIEPNVAEELAIDLRLALSGIEALIVQLDRRARKGMA